MNHKFFSFFAIIIFFAVIQSCSSGESKSRPEGAETSNKNTNKNMENLKTLYDFKLKSLDGKSEVDFSQYKGKKVLLVNVASKCGLTPQYEDLQNLHTKYGEKLVIIGIPANNFMGQEPGTNEEIATFCKKNYGVSFQMTEKISVLGNDQHALYKWLTSKNENGWNDQAPTWNFSKYLINEKGELIKYFTPQTKPLDDIIIKAIS